MAKHEELKATWDRLTELRRKLVNEMAGGLKSLDAMDLTVPQSMVLFRLFEVGPQKVRELQQLTGRSQSATSALVNQLESRGLVTRGTKKDDARVTLVEATAKTRKLLGEVEGLRLKSFASAVDKVPPQVLKNFDSALRQLLSSLP
ncbi:MAG: hypothetical protein DI536_27615 [Archangium gephyra]|uniref:HTH marR-type domain-containing protein n=1 Tax=Archangium gephyra TaxID=48 RepID=A0A2W5T3F1_9BACT|nr:MAG: hypothetical protein DI536_27615 [Archangium gephyra]